jgi:hypothetical protein
MCRRGPVPSVGAAFAAGHSSARYIVAQRVHRHALVDLRSLGGYVDGSVELTRAPRIDGVQSRKQPAVGQHLAQCVRLAPPVAQQVQRHRREHRVPILLALALLARTGSQVMKQVDMLGWPPVGSDAS